MRYITSCLVVLALGLALVQAAPKKIEKKSIADSLAPKAIEQVNQKLDAPENLGEKELLEAADGQNVDRAKKQASTTFCVEIRQNKPTQVDCAELNNNQPMPPPVQPEPETQPQPQQQPEHYPPQEIKIDIGPSSVPMGPPCEPEIAGFIAPGGDVVYAPTGNCAHNIPSTFQTPYYGPSPMTPSGPGGHVHVLHIPGGFPHPGFPGQYPGNYPATGLPGSYPDGLTPNSGAGFPTIQISTGPGGPGGPGGFPLSGLPNGGHPNSGLPNGGLPNGGFPNGGQPNGGLPNGGAGFPTIQISTGPGGPGGYPLSGLPNGGHPNGGLPNGGFPNGGQPNGGPLSGLPNGGLPNGGLPNGGLPNGGAGFPTIQISTGPGGPGGFPLSGLPNGGFPNGGAGIPPLNVIPGGAVPNGLPSGAFPHGGAGMPTINIVPGTGLPGGHPNGGFPSGGSPVHVLHLPGGGLPTGPGTGGNGIPTIYITPGSGTPSVSPLGPHLPSLRPGHLHNHLHGPHHLKGVECTCKSNLGSNLFRSDSGMPSNEQLAAQFLGDLQKNAQQQQHSGSMSGPSSDGRSAAMPGDWGVAKPGGDWGVAKSGGDWGVAKPEWTIGKAAQGQWPANSPNDWSISTGSSGQSNSGKSVGTDARYMPMRPMANSQSQVMYQQQSSSMAPSMHSMHAMPMSGYGMMPSMMGPMMTPGMGMPMRSNNPYDDSFQSSYPMQGLRLSRGPDEADAKAAQEEKSPKPETEEESKKSSNTEILDKIMKKTQDDEPETKNSRLARFLMGEQDTKSNLLDNE